MSASCLLIFLAIPPYPFLPLQHPNQKTTEIEMFDDDKEREDKLINMYASKNISDKYS